MAQRRQRRGAGMTETVKRGVRTAKARAGQARKRARATTSGTASQRRGGQRSATARPAGRTREQLYGEAKRLGVSGRSKMNKEQLQRAVSRKKGS